ncbi:MAG: thioredoxin domain-containing protein, partial [Dehalococcoidia bacterium]
MPNRLANETSPYLLQHKDNPVDWYPWSDEAFAKARAEDKPVLLSVGYSACHWCHVMEHESFENNAIAAQMNDGFVSIKVDREERPDIDSIYMSAVQSMTGRGGWPMTVFLTPEGMPFYGGTYYPPEDRGGMPGFPRLLTAVLDAYRNRRSDLEEQAGRIVEAIS